MHSKKIFIVSTTFVFSFILLWIGHTTLTNAAGLRPYSRSVSIQPTTDSFTAVLSGTNTVSETFKLVSTNPITDGRYGRSVAIYEDTLVVGEDHGVLTTLGTDAMGYLYIHERHAGGFNNWGVTKVITPSDSADGHGLGTALVFDGETLIAGATTANGNANVSGAAYIFERNHGGSNNWGEVAKLVAPDGAYWDRFGWTVAFDGDTAVVGARWHDNARGSAYIYERNMGGPNNWGFVKELTASNRAIGDLFGISVDIDGDTIVVGESDKNLNGTHSGLVHIFERNEGGANNWGEVLQIAPDSPQSNDRFGDTIAIDGNLLAVGTPETDTSRTGKVYLFERNTGGTNNWGQITKITPSDGQPNGRFSTLDIDLKGGTLVVGAGFTDGLVSQSGTAYVYKQDPNAPTQWNETAKLVASDGNAQDEFGISVSFYDDTYVVGAFYDDELCPDNSDCDTGTVYVYAPFHQVYLPTVLSASTTSFPIHIGDPILGRPIAQGETFYTATVAIPDDIPTTGQFFLSADADFISKIGVDDEVAIVLDSDELFVKTFALNGSTIHQEIVEVPRNVMEQMAGQTVSVIYRDVYGQQASASEVWLIWVPEVAKNELLTISNR